MTTLGFLTTMTMISLGTWIITRFYLDNSNNKDGEL